ncbi:MAG: hypothetical protein H6835_04515 [Planctomycetes bacterium]|nr:hypothetical protein [Planctomycetota bacterium]
MPSRRWSLFAAAAMLAGCAAPAPAPAPPPQLRVITIGELRDLARGGELDAVPELTIVGDSAGSLSALAALPRLRIVRLRDYPRIDAETIVRLLQLPQLEELDLGALPGLLRRGETVSITNDAQMLLSQLILRDPRPRAGLRLVVRGDDGTSLARLAELARPSSVELDLSGLLPPHDQAPRRAGSSFDPEVQRRDGARSLVQATALLASRCELVR